MQQRGLAGGGRAQQQGQPPGLQAPAAALQDAQPLPRVAHQARRHQRRLPGREIADRQLASPVCFLTVSVFALTQGFLMALKSPDFVTCG